MKKILAPLLFLAIYFFPSVISATDKTITCTNSACTQDNPSPLFYETNIYPGFLVSKELKADNTRPDICNLNFSASDTKEFSSNLPGQIMISVTSGVITHYSGSLESLFTSFNHSLGTLDAGTSAPYLFTASFNQGAGNEFQNLTAKFNLNVNFECLEETSPTSTPTPISTAVSVSEGSVQGVTISNNPSDCSDTAPTGAPTLLFLTPGANGVTLNWSEGAGPLTYYLIAYGTSSGADQYGNPNIGGPGTTSYTVGSLSPGLTYYFKVRAGNGCATGPFSNELSGGPSGGVIIPSTEIPSGFQPGVLGEQTEEPTTEQSGDVAGLAEECSRHWLPLLWFLALLVNLLIYYYQLKKTPNRRSPYSHYHAILVSLITYLVDRYFLKNRCCLLFPPYCQYLYLAHMVSFLLPWYYYHKRAK